MTKPRQILQLIQFQYGVHGGWGGGGEKNPSLLPSERKRREKQSEQTQTTQQQVRCAAKARCFVGSQLVSSITFRVYRAYGLGMPLQSVRQVRNNEFQSSLSQKQLSRQDDSLGAQLHIW